MPDLFAEISQKEKRLDELTSLDSIGSKEVEEMAVLVRWLNHQYDALGDRHDALTCAKFGVAL